MQSPVELFMQRALDLARQGAGNVAPNPMVGCIIVHENKIIGEGFHQQFGGPHAEVHAIQSVRAEHQHLLPHSTLIVNLEPCSHYGKTPPCADLIIENKIPNVVIGTPDPNPLVAGSGIAKLQNANCRLQIGVLEQECRYLNKRFFTFIGKKRPYVILKWAQTADGFIAPLGNERTDISNEYSRTLVHRWRSEEAAVMVGTRTALYDNPRLDARMWNSRNPLRITLDKLLRLPVSLHLFDRSIPTLVFTEQEKENEHNLEFTRIEFKDKLPATILHQLYQKNIQSLLVEGGSILLQSFIDSGYWDEARIFIAPKFMGEGIAAPKFIGTLSEKEMVGDDELMIINHD